MMTRMFWVIGGALALALLIMIGLTQTGQSEQGSVPLVSDGRLANLGVPTDPVRAISLAPDGGSFAWISAQATGGELWLSPTDGAPARRLLRRTDARALYWSRDGKWLFLEDGGAIVALTLANDLGSGVIAPLGGETGRRFLRVDAGQDAAILVSEEEDMDGDGQPDQFILARIYPGGEREQLWSGPERVSDALVASDGTGYLAYSDVDAPQISRFGQQQGLEPVYRCHAMESCDLVSLDIDGNLYLTAASTGDLIGVQRIDSEGRLASLGIDPKGISDIGSVTLDPMTQRPALALYPYANAQITALSSTAEALAAGLRTDAASLAEVRIAGIGGGTALVGRREAQSPAMRWELRDLDGSNARPALPQAIDDEIAADAAEIHSSALSSRVIEQYIASDGMRLFAYVTRPPNPLENPPPMVVIIHPGPWSAIGPGYGQMAPYLAAQGYIVVEPQFRGSKGYGRRYLTAAGDDYGDGRVMQDVVDSAQWLIERGEADPDRVVAMGSSFGGYFALLAASARPEHFAGAIAMAPPTDFGESLSMAGTEDPDFVVTLAGIGINIRGTNVVQRLSDQSPLALTASLRRPILVISGGQDPLVRMPSVTHYVSRLCQRGSDVTFFVAPNGGHNLLGDQLSEDKRGLIDQFLSSLWQPGRVADRPEWSQWISPATDYKPCLGAAG